ncbi:MAG: Crp/Fnr family transcriptional regulator [Anaerolineae bacterium]
MTGELPIDPGQTVQLTSWERYPQGHIFFRPGEPATTLYLIHRGRVQLYHGVDDTRRVVADYLGPGSFFGGTVLYDRPHYLTAEAVTPVEVSAIAARDINELQKDMPDLVALLVLDLIKQLEHIQRVYTRTPLTTPARLAGLLLLLMDEQTYEVAGFSHQNLAEMLGTHREFVTQTLANFRDKGVVDTGYKRILILDPQQLRSMAGS